MNNNHYPLQPSKPNHAIIPERMRIDTSNPRQRCPVALVLDTSGSMDGQPIAELQRGVDLFIADILKDDVARLSIELTVITFGGDVKLAMPFQSFAKTDAVYSPELTASGATPMGEALELAFNEGCDHER
jgi:uncharacterized protein YegL